MVNTSQPKAAQLLELIPLFERMAGGKVDTGTHRKWCELLSVFPAGRPTTGPPPPAAAVELDGTQHDSDPVTQARDRLKNSLCKQAGLPLVRVRWGDRGALERVLATLQAV